MEVSGQLKMKASTQVVSDKFSKRDFVLATDLSTPYPQFISFQVTQDKCAVLDGYNVGDEIKVHFNLRGREYNNPTKGLQYFNTLEAWKITGVSQFVAPTKNVQAENHAIINNDDSGLPF